MYKELVVYRNELKNNKVPKYKMIGIVSELLFCKEIFKKNSEIVVFLKAVFEISYKEYVLRSRTMIISRIVKTIHNADSVEYNMYKRRLMDFISDAIEEWKKKENSKENRNEFNGWLV